MASTTKTEPSAKDEGTEEPRRRSSMEDPINLSVTRIVLVGKTGAGKSSSGNTILGRRAFRDANSGSSVTKECCKETGMVAGGQLVIVDTPGLFDTNRTDKGLLTEISKCINMTSPGPHAIVLVLNPGPFTEEEQNVFKKIRVLFGEEAVRYTIILFTHRDELGSGGIKQYVNEGQEDLKKLVDQCGGRYHAFDNKKMDDRNQVVDFLEKVEDMVAANGQGHYTNDMYYQVEKNVSQKEKELRAQYEKDLDKKKRELPPKYQQLSMELTKMEVQKKEIEKDMKSLELTDQNRIRRTMESVRYLEKKLETVREEAEEKEENKELCTKIKEKLQDIHLMANVPLPKHL